MLTLPTDSKVRKEYPILSGVVRYFPAALAEVSRVSKRGNDKHNKGEPLHHARGKSMDHGDCIMRHTVDLEDLLAYADRNTMEGHAAEEHVDLIIEEAAQRAWRALAALQELCEHYHGAPLAPGARL
jgi:hypothetical protein